MNPVLVRWKFTESLSVVDANKADPPLKTEGRPDPSLGFLHSERQGVIAEAADESARMLARAGKRSLRTQILTKGGEGSAQNRGRPHAKQVPDARSAAVLRDIEAERVPMPGASSAGRRTCRMLGRKLRRQVSMLRRQAYETIG